MSAASTSMHESASTAGGPVVLHGVSWEQYDALVRALGDDHPSLRMTYIEGTLEIMTTSKEHERIKKIIARLLEMWAAERGANIDGYGAATFRKEAAERGLEPDECYSLGPLRDVPDLAIEVVHRHGGIEKLDVYAGLAIPEVWFWEGGALSVYVLAVGCYERASTSRALPSLDLAQLSSFVLAPGSQSEVVRAYRDALRAGG